MSADALRYLAAALPVLLAYLAATRRRQPAPQT